MGIMYGLGRFGDRRLQKGGPCCTVRWCRGPARVFADSRMAGRARCALPVFCTTGV